jgi:beta-glucosidase
VDNYLVQWPFGYGLSYTTWKFGEIQLSKSSITPSDDLVVSVDISHAGGTDRDSISVLMFVSQHYRRVTPEVKRLRNFTKITLDNGETTTVSFTLKPAELAYYGLDENVKTLENGNFTIAIGGSSIDFELTGAETVKQPLTGGFELGPRIQLALTGVLSFVAGAIIMCIISVLLNRRNGYTAVPEKHEDES